MPRMHIFLVFNVLFLAQHACTMEHVPQVFKNLPKDVQRYFEDLPKIATLNNSDDSDEKSRVITDYLLDVGGYQKNVADRDSITEKVLAYIKSNKPIEMLMPGFPVPSGNPNKVYVDDMHSFSLGDLVALLTQNHISKEIGTIHKPGSILAIYYEPWIYDLNNEGKKQFGLPLFSDDRIKSYQSVLKQLVQYLEPSVTIGKLPENKKPDEVYAEKYSNLEIDFDEKKSKKDAELFNYYKIFIKKEVDFPIFSNNVEKKIFEHERATLENNGKFAWIKNMAHDKAKKDKKYKVLYSNLANGVKSYKDEAISALAKIVIIGSRRMAKMLENEIPNYKDMIRVSVRGDQFSVKNKIGTSLIYGSKGTPWHNVLVVSAKGIVLMHYDELNKKKTKDGAKPIQRAYAIDGHHLYYFE